MKKNILFQKKQSNLAGTHLLLSILGTLSVHWNRRPSLSVGFLFAVSTICGLWLVLNLLPADISLGYPQILYILRRNKT